MTRINAKATPINDNDYNCHTTAIGMLLKDGNSSQDGVDESDLFLDMPPPGTSRIN